MGIARATGPDEPLPESVSRAAFGFAVSPAATAALGFADEARGNAHAGREPDCRVRRLRNRSRITKKWASIPVPTIMQDV